MGIRKIVKITVPRLEGILPGTVAAFMSAHLPEDDFVSARYIGEHCHLEVDRRSAAAANVLYYSIPDWAETRTYRDRYNWTVTTQGQGGDLGFLVRNAAGDAMTMLWDWVDEADAEMAIYNIMIAFDLTELKEEK